MVLDTQGEPLPGASIYVKGDTRNGVTADANGRFTLAVPAKTKAIIVSFVGMEQQEVVLLDRTDEYSVRLQSSTTIDEVVVTGIVTKRKDTFTGSSASFSGEELKAVGVQNPLASLRSLDPSFNLMESDLFGSDPNRLPDIEIRGKSSIMGMRDEVSEDPNQPLFILDGFESTLETIYNLDINRIASMTILKDAASTAIYGSKAANGVVVVETVQPQPGQLRLSYNGSMDISWPDLTSYNLMNSREKLEFERLAGKYDGGTADELIEKDNLYQKHLADIASGVDTYWLSEPLRTGINHRHQLYADGGAGGFMFGIGLNYNGVTGVMKGSDRDVLGANIDLIYRVGKLQFTNKFTAQQTKYTNPIVPFSDYAEASPYYKKYNEDGEVERWLSNNDYEPNVGNPLYNASLNSRDETKDFQLSDYFLTLTA
ncbi:carboxypeptidase-like regulatory domain-containing protein [Bacteroides sp. Marseille-P3684]|uniref:carboxypeptidase-like regulatory domain-containing protein n=1 Tax=Bacteroides sp. Marseille-P3684 TaxID=2086579 RepID=UPI002100C87E|nr:carboxypeptidase-like regulatory domain-containing protein [Bacteroides sp. Marseille-P3684]